MDANRNGFLFCIKHKPDAKTGCLGGAGPYDQMMVLNNAFAAYAEFLMKLPTKIGVVVLTLLLLSVSIWGNVLLKQKFDPMWFLPLDSYLMQWSRANEQ